MISLIPALPIAENTQILEFYTRNRVANGKRLLEILEQIKINRDSFALNEIKQRLPRYEFAEEIVAALNAKGHDVAADGFVPAFTLSYWCDRDRLNLLESAVDARAIPEQIHSRGLEVVAVEAAGEIAAFMQDAGGEISSPEDFFELLDLATCHNADPLRILARTRDR